LDFAKMGSIFLVEPQLRRVGDKLPRLTTLRYYPKMSVAWDGSKISFYSHETRKYEPHFSKLIPMVAEWLVFWGWFWLKALPRLPIFLGRRVAARLTRKRDSSIADSSS
jgi:hypothetical protein